ncbi:MAG: metal-dependent hydrolase [Nonlabens sp.]
MDSLTQIVLGAAVGEVVLGRKVGNKAMLYGAIAGTIPDLDVLARNFTDTINATEIHRGFSHSILFAIIAAPLLGWMVNKIEHKKNLGWRPWTWLFFWGIFTHPLLDAFTTWGTQIFYPADYRVAFNSIFVIDPLYTLPFLVCTIWAMFLRRGSLSRKRTNLTGIVLSSSYLLLSVVLKLLALHQFESALSKLRIEYNEISTRPAALNTILWNANVDTEDAYLIGDYSFFDSEPLTFKSYPKNRANEPHFNNPQSEENLQRLIDISQGWYLLEEKDGDWYFYDLRFGLMPTASGKMQFVFAYKLIEENGILTAEETPKAPRDAGLLMKKLWERVKGN